MNSKVSIKEIRWADMSTHDLVVSSVCLLGVGVGVYGACVVDDPLMLFNCAVHSGAFALMATPVLRDVIKDAYANAARRIAVERRSAEFGDESNPPGQDDDVRIAKSDTQYPNQSVVHGARAFPAARTAPKP